MRRHTLKTQDVAWSERSADCYAGKTCDQVEPRWSSYWDGDKSGEEIRDVITLDPKTFPAGTRITISMPCCPDCSQIEEVCRCGFDWKNWALSTYS